MKTGLFATAFLALFAFSPAFADDFYATPMSPAAPTNLPGENLVPGLSQALTLVNTVTQPILQPILAPGTPAAAPAAAPAGGLHRHHHHRRLVGRHGHHRQVAHLRKHAGSHRHA